MFYRAEFLSDFTFEGKEKFVEVNFVRLSFRSRSPLFGSEPELARRLDQLDMSSKSREKDDYKRLVKQIHVENRKLREIILKLEEITRDYIKENDRLKQENQEILLLQSSNPNESDDRDVCFLTLKLLTHQVAERLDQEENYDSDVERQVCIRRKIKVELDALSSSFPSAEKCSSGERTVEEKTGSQSTTIPTVPERNVFSNGRHENSSDRNRKVTKKFSFLVDRTKLFPLTKFENQRNRKSFRIVASQSRSSRSSNSQRETRTRNRRTQIQVR